MIAANRELFEMLREENSINSGAGRVENKRSLRSHWIDAYFSTGTKTLRLLTDRSYNKKKGRKALKGFLFPTQESIEANLARSVCEEEERNSEIKK